jgi:hypothetical protein
MSWLRNENEQKYSVANYAVFQFALCNLLTITTGRSLLIHKLKLRMSTLQELPNAYKREQLFSRCWLEGCSEAQVQRTLFEWLCGEWSEETNSFLTVSGKLCWSQSLCNFLNVYKLRISGNSSFPHKKGVRKKKNMSSTELSWIFHIFWRS